MTIITIFLFSQSFIDIEYKQAYYPQTVFAESTHSYDVLHYLVDLDLPMTSRYLSGAVTIAMRSNQDNLTFLDLYLSGLQVDSVKVDGLAATYAHSNDTLIVNLPQTYDLGDSFAVKVGYSGTQTGSMGYLWYASTKTISYTLGCAFAEKKWIPCYDALWDKADNGAEYYITVPDSFTVCANGQYLGKTVGGGYATYHWKHDYPISVYLMCFASSIYSTYSDWYHPATSDSVEIKYYFWPQDSNLAHNAFSLTTDMMSYFDSLFGDYPFERFGFNVVYPFYYGGMEHQTLVAILRGWIQGSPNYYGIAHELSHMWWGDMVTCFGWKNVWLNEGFGTYCDALYREHREGHAAFITTMLQRRNSYFGGEDAYPHSIYDPPENLIFSLTHSYHKASWVLHMIRYMCHDDATWLDLMAVYRDSFEYSNASTGDLNRIMNQTLGGDYDWFFQEWVYGMGYPVYDIQWNKTFESPNWRLVLDIDQVQTIGPAVFHMPLPVGVNYASGDTIITLTVDSSYEHFECLLPQEPISIVIDPETWVIQKNIVTAIDESYAAPSPAIIERVQTIGKAIRIRADRQALIEIFDISGRMVYQKHCQELIFKPHVAGVYHAVIEGRTYRYVIVE